MPDEPVGGRGEPDRGLDATNRDLDEPSRDPGEPGLDPDEPGYDPEATNRNLDEPGPELEDAGAERVVGVGPWEGDVPDEPHLDPELIAEGDRRNVADHYRYWSVAAIRADLAARAQPLHLALLNTGRDLNIGSLVRTANAFNVASVQIVGRRRWNRRGAMVTDRYLTIEHRPDAGSLLAWARGLGLAVVGVDNLPGAEPLEGRALPRDAVLVLGEESAGLPAELVAACDLLVAITQHGSTRSLNVAAAGAIAMHTWMTQHAGPPESPGPPDVPAPPRA
ncbi:MAG: TrmH family RNA methyltransferase [Actinomycetaceae bacterium]